MLERDTDQPEVGLAVGAIRKQAHHAWALEASLDELEALAKTAGIDIVARATQRLDAPRPATYIGSGKVDEVKTAAHDVGATVVLFDQDLSPGQQRNLEEALDLKVVDRTALILDIFAQHANTREGMLQVELAQLEYRLPRLTRMWTHLARQAGGRGGAGGVGVRGPGETQLEIDRREIGRRISDLREQIDTLRRQRKMQRRRRRRAGLPVVALVGYTNAGKSTLLNALSGAEVYAANQLFATLDPTTRRVELPSGRTALLTDTVGFIQKLPTQLVAAFHATLEEVTEADLLLHVVDITHPDAVQQAETVERVLDELGVSDLPMVVAANKTDRLPDDGAVRRMRVLYPDLVPVSALEGVGFDPLLAAVEAELDERLELVEALIPYDAGDVLNLLHTHGVVEQETYEADGTRVTARVPAYLLGSLDGYRLDGQPDQPAR